MDSDAWVRRGLVPLMEEKERLGDGADGLAAKGILRHRLEGDKVFQAKRSAKQSSLLYSEYLGREASITGRMVRDCGIAVKVFFPCDFVSGAERPKSDLCVLGR